MEKKDQYEIGRETGRTKIQLT